MLSINILEDEELQDILKKFISSILPHENYNSSEFDTVLQSIFKYVKLEEMNMEYYIICKVLNDLSKIKSLHRSYIPSLTRTTFENVLSTSLSSDITDAQIGVKKWLLYEHLENNLEIETVRQDACQKVYARCLELYDECFAMKLDTNEVLNLLPALKSAFVSHVSFQSLNVQAQIVQGSYQVGRKIYSGNSDWLQYTSHVTSELSARLNDADDNSVIQIDSLDKANILLDTLKDMFVPIAQYGIPEIDGDGVLSGTPILRHRLAVIVGNENIGKSMFAKDQAVNILMAGGKVLYMCGENAKNKIYSELIVNYIYKKYNYFVQPSHIQNMESCPDHIRKVISLAVAEIIGSKSLILRDSYSYDSLYSELVSDYERFNCDAFIIDHSFALTGGYDGDNGKRNIDRLSEDIRSFRKHYPVYCMVLSHPSIAAKDAIAKDKIIEYSATKGSQNLSTDADDVFVLRDNMQLRKEGLIAIENTKRRDADRINDNIILRKMFEVSHFEYDVKYQAKSSSLSVEADAALKNLEDFYNVSDDAFNL